MRSLVLISVLFIITCLYAQQRPPVWGNEWESFIADDGMIGIRWANHTRYNFKLNKYAFSGIYPEKNSKEVLIGTLLFHINEKNIYLVLRKQSNGDFHSCVKSHYDGPAPLPEPQWVEKSAFAGHQIIRGQIAAVWRILYEETEYLYFVKRDAPHHPLRIAAFRTQHDLDFFGFKEVPQPAELFEPPNQEKCNEVTIADFTKFI